MHAYHGWSWMQLTEKAASVDEVEDVAFGLPVSKLMKVLDIAQVSRKIAVDGQGLTMITDSFSQVSSSL